jgi:hypothetical protein
MDLFSWLRNTPVRQDERIYGLAFKVRNGQRKFRPPATEALVVIFVLDDNWATAVEQAWARVEGTGYEVMGMRENYDCVPARDWDRYLAKEWPHFVGLVPGKKQIERTLRDEGPMVSPYLVLGDVPDDLR